MNRKIFHNPSSNGYLLVPRTIFNTILKNHDYHSMCEEEAFLTMLFKAYYSEHKKKKYTVNRGETDLSLEKWAELFRWSVWRVRLFFNRLEQQQYITYKNYGKTRIIVITDYEQFCNNETIPNEQPQEKPLNKSGQLFNEFWKTYHELTLLEPSEEEAARRVWKKLKTHEKQMAINNIYDYMMRTERISHLKKAYRYLMDKEFN